MYYYSLFWVLGVITTINKPWDAFTCRLSTLTILANSGSFHALLLTILESQSDFHSCWTPRCAYVLVINTHSFGRFWPVSWTITHCFGVPDWFPRVTNPVVRLRVGINTRSFGRFWPVFWTITHRFGVPKWFPFLLDPKVCLCVGHQHS